MYRVEICRLDDDGEYKLYDFCIARKVNYDCIELLPERNKVPSEYYKDILNRVIPISICREPSGFSRSYGNCTYQVRIKETACNNFEFADSVS